MVHKVKKQIIPMFIYAQFKSLYEEFDIFLVSWYLSPFK